MKLIKKKLAFQPDKQFQKIYVHKKILPKQQKHFLILLHFSMNYRSHKLKLEKRPKKCNKLSKKL